VKERRRTLPPKLKQVSDDIGEALREAKKIRELTIQEEVVQELDKVNEALEQAQKQVVKLLQLKESNLWKNT
jgi:Sec-independent protein translocase protein TatA